VHARKGSIPLRVSAEQSKAAAGGTLQQNYSRIITPGKNNSKQININTLLKSNLILPFHTMPPLQDRILNLI
jgi:hypothetical protein